MKAIGITGGIGTGKSQLLTFLEKNYNARILKADQVAHMLKEPNGECYQELITILGTHILREDGSIDNRKMAECIFKDKNVLKQVNQLIHPAVKRYIFKELDFERKINRIDYFFIEAALLIEENYGNQLDDIWYIYTEDSIRKKRLIDDRGYSIEKINSIISQQLSEKEFRKKCITVIDNSSSLENTYMQIVEKLEEDR